MDYKLIAPYQSNLTIIQTIFYNRGFTNLNDVEHYLNTSQNDILNPLLIDNIDKGAKMLISHIAANHNIMIQVDSDCDGFTSAACLLNYLHRLFPAFVENHVTYRIHDGKEHGIILSTIPDNINLVIAPDASSNDYTEHKELSQRGIDVLVIDHHEAEKISEYACIINNQLCDYPTKSLSGVGMVYKFCSYIDTKLRTPQVDSLKDLVAIGMIADMMDLRDFETKELISEGLNNIHNPFISALKEKQNFSISRHGYFDPFAVSFYISPLINATVRAGTAKEKLIMFEAMLEWKAYDAIASTKRGARGQKETRVEQAVRNCLNIKNRQSKSNEQVLEIIENRIKQNNLLDNKLLIIQMDAAEIENRNLTGLIANQLANKYQKPTLVLNKCYQNDNTITWEGSGRNYEHSQILDFKAFLQSTNLILYAEGHGNAFGAGIADTRLVEFIQTTNNLLSDYDFHPCYQVDAIYQGNNFNDTDILQVADLKPLWGQSLSEPLVVIENLAVHSGNLVLRSSDKNPTLIFKLNNNVELVKFGATQEEFDKLNSSTGCVRINVIGKCDRNIWNGEITAQLKIVDYEIVSSTEYYF